MFLPFRYLLKIQVKASIIIGEEIIRKAKKCSIFLLLISIVKNIAPRNVLPISPINNLDGSQLNNKKANKEDAIGIYKLSRIIEANIKITRKQLATIPSIPSIKLVKLIRETPIKAKTG